MLTSQQYRLLEFINTHLHENGISPSFDEMKDALGLKSKSGVHRLIKALEERGFIRRLANRARALEVVKTPDGMRFPQSAVSGIVSSSNVVEGNFAAGQTKHASENVSETGFSSDTARKGMVQLPLHGKIAAGTPIEALENIDTYVSVPESFLGKVDCYALEVSGDSMIEKGILDGDIILIEKCTTAHDGEIVVALVEQSEATLKTLKRSGKHVALVPANRDYETQIYPAQDVEIQGRLIGLYRDYSLTRH